MWQFSMVAKGCGFGPTVYQESLHFAASELGAAGVDSRTIADRLGHDLRVLLTPYAHLRPGRDEVAADVMGEVLA